jgi:hypothetical protein
VPVGVTAALAVGVAVGAFLLLGSGQTDGTSRVGEFLLAQLPKSQGHNQTPGLVHRDPTEDFAEAGLTENWPDFNFPKMTFAPGEKAKEFPGIDLKPARPNQAVLVWLESAAVAPPPVGIKIRLPNGQTEGVTKWDGKPQFWRTPEFRSPVGTEPKVSLTVPNPDPDGGPKTLGGLTLRWRPNPTELHLHALSIGVTNYTAKGGPRELKYCAKDAAELCAAFKSLKGPLFTEIDARVLTDPTSDQVVTELHRFKRRVQADTPALKLAVVTFAGHGTVFDKEHFVFLPANYNGERPTAVSWGQMKEALGQLGCTTLVILDCCHSGKAALELAADGARPHLDNRGLGDAVTAFAGQQPGLFLLAAADREGYAFEDHDLKHGVMSYEVLQVLTGKAKTGLVTLQDLYNHVSVTVPQRAKQGERDQVVVPSFPGGRLPDRVPIAYHPNPKK